MAGRSDLLYMTLLDHGEVGAIVEEPVEKPVEEVAQPFTPEPEVIPTPVIESVNKPGVDDSLAVVENAEGGSISLPDIKYVRTIRKMRPSRKPESFVRSRP